MKQVPHCRIHRY